MEYIIWIYYIYIHDIPRSIYIEYSCYIVHMKYIYIYDVEIYENVGKTGCHVYHPPVTIFIGGMYKPFPVRGGLWHCFTHIIPIIPVHW